MINFQQQLHCLYRNFISVCQIWNQNCQGIRTLSGELQIIYYKLLVKCEIMHNIAFQTIKSGFRLQNSGIIMLS